MTCIPTNMNTHAAVCRFSMIISLCLPLLFGCQRRNDLGPVANVTSASKLREAFSGGAAESGGDAAIVASGTGWATLRGRFVYDGTPPQMKPYDVKGEDQATCSRGGKAPLQETLLVDSSTKGIANVAIFVRKASRVHESAQPNDDTVLFDQKECVFLTHVIPMTVGQTFGIKNSDTVGHNTKIDGRKNKFNQIIPASATVAFKPQKEEAAPVSVACSIHPWMKAYFLPRENGYYAVTGSDGSFEIANVPAGELLEFQVWHESAGGSGGGLGLGTPEVKELKWTKKGRFKIQLTENEERELNITVPASALGE